MDLKNIFNKKKHSATIGFWLVIGASKEKYLIVCPSLIKKIAVEKIDDLSVEDVWNLPVQIPIEASKNAVISMIPEITSVVLKKDIEKYKSLWEIDAIRSKCEELTKKYIEQLKLTNK